MRASRAGCSTAWLIPLESRWLTRSDDEPTTSWAPACWVVCGVNGTVGTVVTLVAVYDREVSRSPALWLCD